MFAAPGRRVAIRLSACFAALSLMTAPGAAFAQAAKAQAPPGANEDRKEDRAAIRAAVDSFVKAFEARDPKALAAHWTAEGEYKNESGVTVRGRESLEKAFAAFFAKTPEVKAEVRPESTKFLARDVAVEEGSVTIRRGASATATHARFTGLMVREEGRWRFAQMEESPASSETVEDLAWLVGEWKSTSGQGAEIATTHSWTPSKKFLHVRFTLKEKDLSLSGDQVIGVDPATGALHTWTFEATGGVGEADWSRDGDHWVLEAAGTLPDGSTLTETNILRRINEDTFTWQSIDRMHDGSELPDLPPVKVVRVKPAKKPE